MADTTESTTNSATEIPKITVTGRWADEPDDEPTPSTFSMTVNEEQIDLNSLAIDESKKKDSSLLEDPEDSNIEVVTSGETPYTSAVRFEELNLSQELLKGLYDEMKFERPSKIQSISLPMILTPPYKNLIAQAHNGSGKTTCFVLGMLSRVDPKVAAPQALCICPTRELAIQNMEVLLKMGKFTGITSELGLPADKANYIPIAKRAPVTAQVIIGTPGTINKWIAAKKLGTSELKILVFDEADHMLADGGFKEDSVRIMKEIVKRNNRCQVLLFSATFNDVVKAFVTKIVKELFVNIEYNELFVKKKLFLDSVKQYKVSVPDELSKRTVIKDKIMEFGAKVGQTIIFVRTKESADLLHAALVEHGYKVMKVYGSVTQDRDKIVKEFKDGLTHVLISTDVTAGGFDQSQVNLVVNHDLPVVYDNPTQPDNEAYSHRIAREGRFGRKGAVFNLLCGERDKKIMEKIERHFNHDVAEVPSSNSNEDFEDAFKKAGLLQTDIPGLHSDLFDELDPARFKQNDRDFSRLYARTHSNSRDLLDLGDRSGKQTQVVAQEELHGRMLILEAQVAALLRADQAYRDENLALRTQVVAQEAAQMMHGRMLILEAQVAALLRADQAHHDENLAPRTHLVEAEAQHASRFRHMERTRSQS